MDGFLLAFLMGLSGGLANLLIDIPARARAVISGNTISRYRGDTVEALKGVITAEIMK